MRGRHGHNVLGSALGEQEVIREHAADDASGRHHFIAATDLFFTRMRERVTESRGA
jgi:hypothetical protein